MDIRHIGAFGYRQMELASQITGKEPNLTRSMVNTYRMDDHTWNISKSRRELGFHPQNPVEKIQLTMNHLLERKKQW